MRPGDVKSWLSLGSSAPVAVIGGVWWCLHRPGGIPTPGLGAWSPNAVTAATAGLDPVRSLRWTPCSPCYHRACFVECGEHCVGHLVQPWQLPAAHPGLDPPMHHAWQTG